MNAYKISNDIVAAHSPEQARQIFASHFDQVPESVGRACEINPHTFAIDIEEEDGSTRPGFLFEVMPTEPQVVIEDQS